MCAAVNTLKASADFQRISRDGKKCAFPAFIMLALKRDDARAPFRLGLTASRKLGNAVARNRIRRRLREMVRLSIAPEKLQGYDIVLIGRTSARERDFTLMTEDFKNGLAQLGITS